MAQTLTLLPLAAWLLLFATTPTPGDPATHGGHRNAQGSWSAVQATAGDQEIRQVITSVAIGLGHRVTLAFNLPAASCDRFAISMAARGAFFPMAQDLDSDILRVEFEVDKVIVWHTALRLDPDRQDGLQADSGQLSFSEQPLLDALAKGETLRINIALDSQVGKVRVPLQGFREAMAASRSPCVAGPDDRNTQPQERVVLSGQY